MGRIRSWIDRAGKRRGRAESASARRRVLAFEKCEPRLALATAAGAAIGAEGGLINLDVAAGDSVFVQYNGSLSQTIIEDAYDFDGVTVTFGQLFLHGAGDAAADLTSLLNSGHVRNIDLGPAPDGSFHFMGPASYLGAATPSGESEVLRIDMPAQLDDSEGGSINLTAVLQPSGLLPLQRGAELAVAQSESQQPTTPLGGAAATPTISPTESLRARAVVFRVAHTEAPSTSADELLASLAGRVDDELAPADGAEPESREVGRLADAPVARPEQPTGDALPPDAVWLAAAAGEFDVAVSGASSSDAGAVLIGSEPEAAVDAALAAWDDELAPASTESDAGLVFTASRERSIVALAVAAVVGAAPVVRRFRRPGIHAPLEKAAGLR